MTRRTRASATGSSALLLQAGAQVTYAAPFTAYGRPVPDGVTGIDLPRSVGRHRLPAIRAAASMIRKQARDHDVVLLHDPELLAAVAGLRRRKGPGRRLGRARGHRRRALAQGLAAAPGAAVRALAIRLAGGLGRAPGQAAAGRGRRTSSGSAAATPSSRTA
jgi:hypothetical protein